MAEKRKRSLQINTFKEQLETEKNTRRNFHTEAKERGFFKDKTVNIVERY